jgi:serine/threonine-protein kinase RsbW
MGCIKHFSADNAVSRHGEQIFRFSLPCNLSAVNEALSAACSFLTEQALEPEFVTACKLALAEACNNAIFYAAEDSSRLPVEIQILCDPVWCELCVADHTPGFEWPIKPELPEPEAERGRGIFIIHTLMDQVVYARGTGVNRLVMRRRRVL